MRQLICAFTARVVLFSIPMIFASTVLAAQAVDVKHKPAAFLQSFAAGPSQLKSVRTETDFNQTRHVHFQQTYQGYPVWGGDVVVHTRKNSHTTMNGVLYQKLTDDL